MHEQRHQYGAVKAIKAHGQSSESARQLITAQHDGRTHAMCCKAGSKTAGALVTHPHEIQHRHSNNCADNTFAGILVTGTACRIDSNHCTGGQRSFRITGTDNLIIRNSAQGASVLAYDTAAGNHQAALIVSPGLNFASTSPWANFSF